MNRLDLAAAMLVLAMFSLVTPVKAQNCAGCGSNEMTWGGGALNEFWDYTPNAGDSEGVCYANCSWDPCVWVGKLKFTNRNDPGGGNRVVTWPNGSSDVVNLGASKEVNVDVTTGCGQANPPDAHANPVGGGGTTSAFYFYCNACTGPV